MSLGHLFVSYFICINLFLFLYRKYKFPILITFCRDCTSDISLIVVDCYQLLVLICHNATDAIKKYLSDIIETLGEDKRSHLLSMACKIPYLQYGILQAFKLTSGQSIKR